MTNYDDLDRPHVPPSHIFVWFVLGLVCWWGIFEFVKFVVGLL